MGFANLARFILMAYIAVWHGVALIKRLGWYDHLGKHGLRTSGTPHVTQARTFMIVQIKNHQIDDSCGPEVMAEMLN